MSHEILVVGGAGYIGSFAAARLIQNGFQPVVLDNLSTGKTAALPPGVPFYQGDIGDPATLNAVFSRHRIEAVMHFAAKISVSESVERPDIYYGNNLGRPLTLLDAMRAHGIQRFIFSSTAAVYGEPHYLPIDENHPTAPINPYGRSKLMLETVLRDYTAAFGMKALVLRYFNAAGAAGDGSHGESQTVKQNLIPIALEALEKGKPIRIFGTDWDTPDGSPIRDFIHISDIAEAHLLALKHILSTMNTPFDVINLGSGSGASVKEVLRALEKASGKNAGFESAPRREGDPGAVIASNAKAAAVLGWKPRHSDIDSIVSSAYRWHFDRKY